jgi:hypothetical protein
MMKRERKHMKNKPQETAISWEKAYTHVLGPSMIVVRWKSNDRIPFADMMADFVEAGYIRSDVAATSEEFRLKEQDAFLAEYRESQKNRSAEEIAESRIEARAAFGPGETIVNAITGERYVS